MKIDHTIKELQSSMALKRYAQSYWQITKNELLIINLRKSSS